jgi:hypothetical protein
MAGNAPVSFLEVNRLLHYTKKWRVRKRQLRRHLGRCLLRLVLA